jgi:hypothetical protein
VAAQLAAPQEGLSSISEVLQGETYLATHHECGSGRSTILGRFCRSEWSSSLSDPLDKSQHGPQTRSDKLNTSNCDEIVKGKGKIVPVLD